MREQRPLTVRERRRKEERVLLGAKLRAARLARGITQVQVGVVTQSHLSDLEKGRRPLRDPVAVQLAGLYRVDLGALTDPEVSLDEFAAGLAG